MATPSSSSTTPAIPPKYEYLKSLSDIQTIRDLNKEAVRDILRNHTNDYGLEVTEMGDITDMSGLNDAFNSTICSLKVRVSLSGKGGDDKGKLSSFTLSTLSWLPLFHIYVYLGL